MLAVALPMAFLNRWPKRELPRSSGDWGTVRAADVALRLLHDRTFASHEEPQWKPRTISSN